MYQTIEKTKTWLQYLKRENQWKPGNNHIDEIHSISKMKVIHSFNLS